MKNIYFISDVHLAFKVTEPERIKRNKLIDFLKSIHGDAKELYILGDLFDFWFEWHHVIPKYWFPVLFHLKILVESGIKVYLVTGNHDFHTGKYLRNDIGIRCFDEYREFVVGSKSFFVAHGDGFLKSDWGYRILKKVIRSPVSIFLYRTVVPSDIGMQIAKWTSYSSRNLKRSNKSLWCEKYYGYARGKFEEGFDYVVMGHIHYPFRKEDDGKVYVNCGDWISSFTYAKYDGETLTLNYWKG